MKVAIQIIYIPNGYNDFLHYYAFFVHAISFFTIPLTVYIILYYARNSVSYLVLVAIYFSTLKGKTLKKVL